MSHYFANVNCWLDHLEQKQVVMATRHGRSTGSTADRNIVSAVGYYQGE
jgi:hypothetical protein